MREHPVAAAAPWTPVPRVLVADDDPGTRQVCATSLSLYGYEVIAATDGQAAIELALANAPDVVLLELSMPVLDGFGVLAALRADERTREVPLVVLTAETGPHVLKRVHELGVAGLFMKPFDPGVVAAFVRGVVDEVRAGRTPAREGGHAF